MGVADTKIYPINTGWLHGDLGTYIFWKGPAGKKKWQPVYCHYVDTGTHKVLIDTGLPDQERASKYHHNCEKRGCLQVHEHLEQKLGVKPEEIDAILFTHLHWDHVQNMDKFPNARMIAPRAEFEMAFNPLPLYYRTYESGTLGIDAPFHGHAFELIDDECEILPGLTMFHTPGHSVGHMAVSVATSMGDICVVGDAIFEERNLEPNPDEMWRFWVPARFVNSVQGWKSVEEIDKRADYVLPCHDPVANARSDVFPYEGMPIRKRRQTIPGFRFYFGDMPAGTAAKAAPAMPAEEVEAYLASLEKPSDMEN